MLKILATIATLLITSIASAATIDNANCPSLVKLTLVVGTLSVDDRADQDFKSLENTRTEDNFHLQSTRDGCLYSNATAEDALTVRMSEKLFLLLKPSRGETKVSLNGYTRNSGKLFEIRAFANEALADLNGTYDAGFFDASGPAREFLGKATFTINLN